MEGVSKPSRKRKTMDDTDSDEKYVSIKGRKIEIEKYKKMSPIDKYRFKNIGFTHEFPPYCRLCFGKHRIKSCYLKELIYEDKSDELSEIRDLFVKEKLSIESFNVVINQYFRNYISFYPISLMNHKEKMYKTGLTLKDFPDKLLLLQKFKVEIPYDKLINSMKIYQNSKPKICKMCDGCFHTSKNCPVLKFSKEMFSEQLTEFIALKDIEDLTLANSTRSYKKIAFLRELYSSYIFSLPEMTYDLPHISGLNDFFI